MIIWQRIKLIGLFIFVLLYTSALSAEVYTLGQRKLDLPFEKSWMAKTDNPESNLLFFDPKYPNPRPIVQVALSAFRYPKDLSVFIDRYKREKNGWVGKQSGKLVKEIEHVAESKSRLIYFQLHFSIPIGEFFEWSMYHQCEDEFSLSLKMMVPVDSSKTMSPHWDELLASGLCG
jgi:hypothetical protein